MSLRNDSHGADQTHGSAEPARAGRPAFADEVRGHASQPVDFAFAKMIRDIYDDEGKHPDGARPWVRVDDAQLRRDGIDPTLLRSDASGFRAAVYTDGQGRYTLAFAGTDQPKDWLTNFGQGLGFDTAQYNQAMALAKQAKVAYGQELAITGQSLGGGLAAVAAIATDTPAVTFNAAGVHDNTLERVGLDASAAKREAERGGLIRRYAVQNDLLTQVQEHTPILRGLMPDAVGHKIELPDPRPLSGWQRLNPVKAVKHGIDVHYIEAVIESMELKYGRQDQRPQLLSDASHPNHGTYAQALHAVRNASGRPHGIDDARLAGAIALQAQKDGLPTIDSVAFVQDGRRAFAFHGDAQSPTRRHVSVDVEQAMRTSVADTSAQSLRWNERTAPGAPQPEQASPVLPRGYA